jgi:hypothetical protein
MALEKKYIFSVQPFFPWTYVYGPETKFSSFYGLLSSLLGYSVSLPTGWHVKCLKCPSVFFANTAASDRDRDRAGGAAAWLVQRARRGLIRRGCHLQRAARRGRHLQRVWEKKAADLTAATRQPQWRTARTSSSARGCWRPHCRRISRIHGRWPPPPANPPGVKAQIWFW